MIDLFNSRTTERGLSNCENMKLNINTGELKGNLYGNEGNIKLNQSEAHTIFSGSIHKFFNDNILENNKGNSNDYNYDQLCSSIDILDSKLKINFKESKLTQLEFGYNLTISKAYNISHIINSIKSHKELVPTSEYSNKKRHSKFFKRDLHTIKIYDKSRQYKLSNQILRVENKMSSKVLKSFGIYTINDLKDKSKLELLHFELMKRFDELVIVDFPIAKGKLKLDELYKVFSFSNPDYWKHLRVNKYSRTHISNKKKEFKDILAKHKLDSYKNHIKTLMQDKFTQLINSNSLQIPSI